MSWVNPTRNHFPLTAIVDSSMVPRMKTFFVLVPIAGKRDRSACVKLMPQALSRLLIYLLLMACVGCNSLRYFGNTRIINPQTISELKIGSTTKTTAKRCFGAPDSRFLAFARSPADRWWTGEEIDGASRRAWSYRAFENPTIREALSVRPDPIRAYYLSLYFYPDGRLCGVTGRVVCEEKDAPQAWIDEIMKLRDASDADLVNGRNRPVGRDPILETLASIRQENAAILERIRQENAAAVHSTD